MVKFELNSDNFMCMVVPLMADSASATHVANQFLSVIFNRPIHPPYRLRYSYKKLCKNTITGVNVD
jgi:hypothetical protein